jgi:uncharacterized protein (DUF488 family)
LITIYTIGYQGCEPEQFLDKLTRSGVKLLVDVRDLPASRKKGFSKKSLAELLERHGISYRHVRELGSPSELRHQFVRDGDWDHFARNYRTRIEKRRPFIDELSEAARASHLCLMCYEADARTCHRSLVADELAERLQCPVRVINIP